MMALWLLWHHSIRWRIAWAWDLLMRIRWHRRSGLPMSVARLSFRRWVEMCDYFGLSWGDVAPDWWPGAR